MECHPKWNFSQNGISLKTGCRSKCNVTQMKCHSKWYVAQNGLSLKNGMLLRWNIIQNWIAFKFECHSNWSLQPRLITWENFLRGTGARATAPAVAAPKCGGLVQHSGPPQHSVLPTTFSPKCEFLEAGKRRQLPPQVPQKWPGGDGPGLPDAPPYHPKPP